MAKKKVTKTTKTKKKERVLSRAKFVVNATFNNTIATVTDLDGEVLCWTSAGSVGFKGTKKQTPYAATVTVEKAAQKAKELGVKTVEVYIKGPGPGRDAALRAIHSSGLKMALIADITPVPHNGPRPKKKRRGK